MSKFRIIPEIITATLMNLDILNIFYFITWCISSFYQRIQRFKHVFFGLFKTKWTNKYEISGVKLEKNLISWQINENISSVFSLYDTKWFTFVWKLCLSHDAQVKKKILHQFLFHTNDTHTHTTWRKLGEVTHLSVVADPVLL